VTTVVGAGLLAWTWRNAKVNPPAAPAER
jgi:hypothetical protein